MKGRVGSDGIGESMSRVGLGQVMLYFGQVVKSRHGIRCGTVFHNLMLNVNVLVTSQPILSCYHGSIRVCEI